MGNGNSTDPQPGVAAPSDRDASKVWRAGRGFHFTSCCFSFLRSFLPGPSLPARTSSQNVLNAIPGPSVALYTRHPALAGRPNDLDRGTTPRANVGVKQRTSQGSGSCAQGPASDGQSRSGDRGRQRRHPSLERLRQGLQVDRFGYQRQRQGRSTDRSSLFLPARLCSRSFALPDPCRSTKWPRWPNEKRRRPTDMPS